MILTCSYCDKIHTFRSLGINPKDSSGIGSKTRLTFASGSKEQTTCDENMVTKKLNTSRQSDAQCSLETFGSAFFLTWLVLNTKIE
jgi:hypothetical protein